MRRDLITSACAVVVLTLLLGIAYPLFVTGVGKVAFPDQADGSLIKLHGRVIGSRLLGQSFARNPRYFQERPSTATKYAADASAFTNLGPNSRQAKTVLAGSIAAYLRLESPYNPGLDAHNLPIDAVTSSASGLDPQISVANARIQAKRVAHVRGLSLAAVRRLIDDHTDGRWAGVFGQRAVNVLELNLALDGAGR